MHTALIAGLTADTDYAFIAESTIYPNFDKTVRWFRTMGADGNTSVTVALGGDTGHNPWATAINAHVGSNDADLAVISGDVAYTNGMASCYQMWDAWLTMYQRVVSSGTLPHAHNRVRSTCQHIISLSLYRKHIVNL